MFGLFKSGKTNEPLDYESRKYFENNLLWLNQEFPYPMFEQRKIFTPTKKDFPFDWDGTETTAINAVKIVSENMQISFDDLEIDFYDSGIQEIDMGNNTLFLENDPASQNAAGLYFDEKQNGKFSIAFDKKYLNRPEALIATIAHELSHVKLHGEKKISGNDECLVDMTTVFFGFGIFNANSCFRFYQESDRWGYNQLGYLKQQEWAYVIALFAYAKREYEPEWSEYLNPTIRKDFQKCLRYMTENQSEIFRFDEKK